MVFEGQTSGIVILIEVASGKVILVSLIAVLLPFLFLDELPRLIVEILYEDEGGIKLVGPALLLLGDLAVFVRLSDMSTLYHAQPFAVIVVATDDMALAVIFIVQTIGWHERGALRVKDV